MWGLIDSRLSMLTAEGSKGGEARRTFMYSKRASVASPTSLVGGRTEPGVVPVERGVEVVPWSQESVGEVRGLEDRGPDEPAVEYSVVGWGEGGGLWEGDQGGEVL
ncbi:hypothetical protein TrRE_jg5147 [Triparma retinervis]|uniref:Uncharacterized protein n=1 Tax=Triparma retinervis TaxID=2557542 RepID=A0A9W7DX46_9STRA|nr:hypothetical protein TrRE_jg5147 [Triparma retinervis]